MWKDLTMSQRADMMDLYLSKGITSLDDMRSLYDSSISGTAQGTSYAGGGSIHIDPSKKGTFTAAASRHGMGVQEFASKVLANKENYSPAMVKKANFARNASKWHGHGESMYAHGGEFGNYYDGWGDALNFLKFGVQKARQKIRDWGLNKSPAEHIIELFTSNKEDKQQQKRYKAVDGSAWSSKEEAAKHNSNLVNDGKYYFQIAGSVRGVKRKMVPRRPNTSSTSQKSMELENMMYTGLDGYRERVGYRTRPYDIPYGTKEIKVKPKGSTVPFSISVNALDSVAKYAGLTGTPIEIALGLPTQETGFGRRPYFNYGKLGKGYSDIDLGNANYFKNFGSIPAEYLVRDFRYNGDIVYDGKRPEPVSLDTPPLQHALELFNAGKYNSGDKSHTHDVLTSGNNLWNETTGSLQNWWQTEGKEWYNRGSKQKKK